MSIINYLRISLASIMLVSGVASGNIVEILFNGEITRNFIYEEIYGASNGPYVPVGFENETLFQGVLRYDDQAPIMDHVSTLGNLYGTAEIELTIGDNYTVTDTGSIFIKNDYGGTFDLMTFIFQDFPVNYINPADEMIFQNNLLRLEFYDDDLSIFDANEKLPTAGTIEQFDRLLLRDLNILSEGNSILIDCPECVEGVTEVFPRQEIIIEGTLTTATASAVPLPPSLLLFATGLGLFYITVCRTGKNSMILSL